MVNILSQPGVVTMYLCDNPCYTPSPKNIIDKLPIENKCLTAQSA